MEEELDLDLVLATVFGSFDFEIDIDGLILVSIFKDFLVEDLDDVNGPSGATSRQSFSKSSRSGSTKQISSSSDWPSCSASSSILWLVWFSVGVGDTNCSITCRASSVWCSSAA